MILKYIQVKSTYKKINIINYLLIMKNIFIINIFIIQQFQGRRRKKKKKDYLCNPTSMSRY